MNITQSLFGITPQDVQAQRQTELDKRAVDFAKLTPIQQAQAGFYRAGSMFGDAAAGALGYEDPQVAQARQRQGMLGGLNLNDPESLLQAAQGLQGTDPEAALYLRGQGQELLTAQTAKAEADAKALAEQRRLASLAQLVMNKTGLSPEQAAALAQDPAVVRGLMEEETIVVNSNGRSVLRNKRTGAEIKDLGTAPETGTRVTVTPTIKMGGDAVGLMKGIADLTKPEQEMLKSAQTSKVLINEAAASNNSQTWEAARTQIAKAVGEGKLSNEDIRRTGIDPRLVQGALDWINKKTVGVPNQDIMKQLYVVSDLLEKQATARINNTMGQARTLATDVSGVSPAAAQTIFPMVGGQGSGGGAVNWKDLK